jgi:hypothetical protein
VKASSEEFFMGVSFSHGGSLMSLDFVDCFSGVEEPRIDRTKRHAILDVLFISVAGTIAGCDGPSDIASFAKTQLAWCRKFVPLENGVPSHDTIGRVISLIKPDQFQKAFLDWVSALASSDEPAGPNLVPIDGKTLRNSGGANDRENPLHVVSAWATRQGMTLGQVAVDSKSNEITAIPKLLEMLELKGAIISIDAMGCQKEIAEQIVKSDGDFVLALKDNHPKLCEAVNQFFLERYEQEDFGKFGCRQHRTIQQGTRQNRDATLYDRSAARFDPHGGTWLDWNQEYRSSDHGDNGQGRNGNKRGSPLPQQS